MSATVAAAAAAQEEKEEKDEVSRALFDLDCDPLAARVAHLEQTLTREEPLLQLFHSELRANFAAELEGHFAVTKKAAVRAQLLEEFREQVQAEICVQKQQAMAELQAAKEDLRERGSARLCLAVCMKEKGTSPSSGSLSNGAKIIGS
ncbi:hypothetical protein AK812_SmicGene37216 [Symbiodinium microadriaticum]|uniref:Uncharacterized protein n=1 Tax=Symbiodinium microadriaticum TaxID=2951 RepID=A0A1Q9CGX2_SYMMI|nr:hypothetical protein AK812_SmicGene37216 [Symbiodinium microadriaticum]